METLVNILKIIFCPFAILEKFVTKDDTGGLFVFLSFVVWVIAIFVAWFAFATTAGPLFQAIVYVIAYFLTLISMFRHEGVGDSLWLGLIGILVAAIAGFAVGILGHAFFLLYLL